MVNFIFAFFSEIKILKLKELMLVTVSAMSNKNIGELEIHFIE